jgi:hypothetical protein
MVKLHKKAELSFFQAFTKLSMLLEQRGDAYANADARVSLEGTILILALSTFAPLHASWIKHRLTSHALYSFVQRLQLSRAMVMFLS